MSSNTCNLLARPAAALDALADAAAAVVYPNGVNTALLEVAFVFVPTKSGSISTAALSSSTNFY